jgi:6-phosphofructokinase 2
MSPPSVSVPTATDRIATLTLNPSLDVSYEVPQLIANEKAHASHGRYDPGGNGINVGRALKTLGVPAANYCVLAGEIGLLVERLVAGLTDDPHTFRVPGESRVGCTIVQKAPRIQYEVSGIGPAVTAEALERVAAGFVSGCGSGYAVLTGSLPPGVPLDTYARLAQRLKSGGAKAVVDAKPDILKLALEVAPFLIKPNRLELEMLVGRSLPQVGDVVREARALQRSGVTHVCVSLGAGGALMVDAEHAYYATAPTVTVRSTVGAGDSLLAGVVAAFAGGRSAQEALRLGVACGSGTATKPGTSLFTLEDVWGQMEEIEVEVLEA